MKNKLLTALALLSMFSVTSCLYNPSDSPSKQPSTEQTTPEISESLTDNSTPSYSSPIDSSTSIDSSIPSESSIPESSTPESSTPESSIPESSTPSESTTPSDSSTDVIVPPEEKYQVVTVAEANSIAQEADNTATEAIYLLTATVDEILNASYGEMVLKDETGSIYAYGVHGKNDEFFDKLTERPGKGDVVTLLVSLKMYNGDPEIYMGYLQSFVDTPEEEFDITGYTEMSIQQAREAIDESKLIVSGTVAKITYAFGMVPNGFYLINNNSSIYVYGQDVAGSVNVGNDVKVAATKDYYILADETNNASKHGYKGSNQLAEATILENDKGNNNIDLSFAQEKTIKEIMDNPVSNDITTNIYKVNALVKKVVGTGFTNYYFNDIDGYTGSYAYSQCSGSDFAWLDEFHNKICTVYLSPINCKSTPSESFYRFIPIKVSYDNYTFDVAKAPEFALNYYALEQFKSNYEADPTLEVVTKVSSDLLGLSDISVSYSSSNTDVVYFENSNDKLVMHTNNEGNATVSVTATYQSYTLTKTVEITVQKPITYETITIAQAIAASDGTEVTVRGIVTSSLVNKSGFYISDDTGIIAVQCTADELAKIELGNEVIIKGVRVHNKKETSTTIVGQSNIKDAEVLVNLYGQHQYNTSSYDDTKSFADLYALDKNVDYSTTPFIVNGILKLESTAYYTKLAFVSEDGKTTLTLYMSGAGQYSTFADYYNQVCTFEVIPCNWNDKNFWAFCIISLVTEDGKIINDLNFKTN